MSIPGNLKYTKDHEWLKLLSESEALIGITDFAQQSLGDITFVELPEIGDELEAGATLGVVESVKAASDLYLPVEGEVIETNAELETAPETINRSPYEAGWIAKIKLAKPEQADELLDAAAYAKICEE